MIHICEDYLYEFIEDYKEAKTQSEKDKIFNSFCKSIWASPNKRKTFKRTIRFSVQSNLLSTDIGRVFDMWSEVEYRHYKLMTKDKDWCSLIRQKINNLYTKYCDKEVIVSKDYMDLLKTPKRLYYRWLAGKETDIEYIINTIDDAMEQAVNVKAKRQLEKIDLSWADYKKVIEQILRRTFEHCVLSQDHLETYVFNIYDFTDEDNFYVKYFCKCLDGEMKNWTKKYYGVKRGRNKKYKRCEVCGALITRTGKHDFSSKYCDKCKKQIIREQTRKRVQKHRKKQCNES